ncbi:MAG: sulfatase-like hydrolase/transferase, partial [Gammaproteobacteria bacterium]
MNLIPLLLKVESTTKAKAMRPEYLVSVLLLLIGANSPAEPSQRADQTRQPNIVIILADDLGYGDVGVNGAKRIKTPNIDALAEKGVNFTQFFASANVCSPSRAGLMTGRYPIRSGLAHGVIEANDSRGLPSSEETVAELVLRKDYKTMLIGKWHLGNFPEYTPLLHGFEQFYG